MPPSKSKVYFLPWDQRDRLPDLLDLSRAADCVRAGDLVAVKLHFGEKGNTGYIKPEFVRPVLKMIRRKKGRPFLTDTGTIYNGQRTTAVSHLILAAEHGFNQTKLGAPVIIADGLKGDNYEEIEIPGAHFKKVKIAGAICRADSMIVMSHFKGHLLAGFGGAIKNLGMGCSARLGKFEMHSAVAPAVSADNCSACGACIARCAQGALEIVNGKIRLDTMLCAGCGECVVACDYEALSITWDRKAEEVQERFCEYALGAVKNKRVFYLNFINHVTPNCDCMAKDERPMLPDVGILASADPVAIDEASLDIVLEKAGDVFAKAHPGMDGNVGLAYSQKLGLGQREYELVGL